MSKAEWFLVAACALIGVLTIEGFTNSLGAAVISIGASIASYHDGKKAGAREVFLNSTNC